VEFNMMRKNPLLVRLAGGLSLAVLAAVFSLGSPSGAAGEEVLTPALQLIINPMVKTVEGLERRLTLLEASIGGWMESLTTRRLVVQQLCLADDSGGQTCISKGQLDALIRNVARAEIVEPAAPSSTEAESAVAAEATTEPAAETAPAPAEPVSVPSEPVSTPHSEANASPATETMVVVVPIEAIATPVTESGGPAVAEPVMAAAPATNGESETSAQPAAEPVAIEAASETVPATPIALPVEDAPQEQEIEHTGTISPDAPAASVMQVVPSAESVPEQTATEEAPGDE
jgi:hypothetical protein